MDIDQRLDRLTERHEALTESIEMLTHDIREMQQTSAKHDKALDKITQLFVTTGDSINKLLTIAQAHQDRLDRLEGV